MRICALDTTDINEDEELEREGEIWDGEGEKLTLLHL